MTAGQLTTLIEPYSIGIILILYLDMYWVSIFIHLIGTLSLQKVGLGVSEATSTVIIGLRRRIR